MLFKSFLLGALLNFSVSARTLTLLKTSDFISPDQPPNMLAEWNIPYRTGAVNATWFIIPVNMKAVAKVVSPYKLMPLPPTVFPIGSFPNDSHPVIAQIGYHNDIRQGKKQQMEKLMSGSLSIPFVDKLGKEGAADPFIPFSYLLKNWVGAVDNNLQGGIPAAISKLFNAPLHAPLTVADFKPVGPAYSQVNATTYSSQVPSLINMDFRTVMDNMTLFTNHTFHMLLNQPQMRGLAKSDQCVRNTIYFNQTFSRPTFRNGTVTLHDGLNMKGFSGTYDKICGFSAVGQEIGYPVQDCEKAAHDVPGVALG